MPRVNIEGVGIVDFPDDMSIEEIEAAIHRDILPQYPQAAEWPKEPAVPEQTESPESTRAESSIAAEHTVIENTDFPSPDENSKPDDVAEPVSEQETSTDFSIETPERGKDGLSLLDDPANRGGDWVAGATGLQTPATSPVGGTARLGLAPNHSAAEFDANLLLRVWANVGEPARSMAVASSAGDRDVAKQTPVEKDYLQQRLQNQIDWYDRKSQSSQFWYKRLRIVELIAAAMIPFLTGYSEVSVYMTPLVGFLGLLITAVAGILNLNQYQERWVAYRSTTEALQQEKFLYLARCAPYDGEDAFTLLVRRVEGLIGKENNAWMQNTVKSMAKPHNEGEAA